VFDDEELRKELGELGGRESGDEDGGGDGSSTEDGQEGGEEEEEQEGLTGDEEVRLWAWPGAWGLGPGGLGGPAASVGQRTHRKAAGRDRGRAAARPARLSGPVLPGWCQQALLAPCQEPRLQLVGAGKQSTCCERHPLQDRGGGERGAEEMAAALGRPLRHQARSLLLVLDQPA
jgi:hypothetical protein